MVERKKRIEVIDGIGCEPVLISGTTEEMMGWIGEGLRCGALNFPEKAGPILWPKQSLAEVLVPMPTFACPPPGVSAQNQLAFLKCP